MQREVSCSRAHSWLSGRAGPGSLAPECMILTAVLSHLSARGRLFQREELRHGFDDVLTTRTALKWSLDTAVIPSSPDVHK